MSLLRCRTTLWYISSTGQGKREDRLGGKRDKHAPPRVYNSAKSGRTTHAQCRCDRTSIARAETAEMPQKRAYLKRAPNPEELASSILCSRYCDERCMGCMCGTFSPSCPSLVCTPAERGRPVGVSDKKRAQRSHCNPEDTKKKSRGALKASSKTALLHIYHMYDDTLRIVGAPEMAERKTKRETTVDRRRSRALCAAGGVAQHTCYHAEV